MTTSTAVMARRAAGEVPADSAQDALYRTLDFYPTPPWAARVGAELVRELDPEARTVWEPACGKGHMAGPLAETFSVTASDVYPHGFGEVRDFLGDDPGPQVDWIVTNPPFKTGGDFLQRGLARARRGVALLLRLQFLEGCERFGLLYGERPLTVVAPFAERVPMTLGKWDPAQSSATAYAWFLWRKGASGRATLRPIAPGARERLTFPTDADRFGYRQDAPLLDAMEAA